MGFTSQPLRFAYAQHLPLHSGGFRLYTFIKLYNPLPPSDEGGGKTTGFDRGRENLKKILHFMHICDIINLQHNLILDKS